MKVMTILGSPRKKGNTAKILGWFEEGAQGKGIEVDRFNVAGSDINGCLGCSKCEKSTDEPGCVQKDDVLDVFDRMMAADAVVFASPLYCWGFSSQIKALIDRHVALVKGYGTPNYKSLIEGKPMSLLVTCAGPVEDNADVIQVIFDRLNAYAKSKVAGKYIVPFCTTPDAMGDEARETANKMVEGISE